MALKKRHLTDKMATNDMKMRWNCDSDRDNCKINTEIPVPEPDLEIRGGGGVGGWSPKNIFRPFDYDTEGVYIDLMNQTL